LPNENNNSKRSHTTNYQCLSGAIQIEQEKPWSLDGYFRVREPHASQISKIRGKTVVSVSFLPFLLITFTIENHPPPSSNISQNKIKMCITRRNNWKEYQSGSSLLL